MGVESGVARPLDTSENGPQAARPSPLKIWLRAVRVFSFTASITPILVGSALAAYDGAFSAPLILAMLAASVACHAGCNLANDYHDHLRGTDTRESLGPSGVIQQGLLSAGQVRRGMVVAFAIATVLGLGIVAVTDWAIFVLALLCLAAAYLYTGGPRPLGYVALGEVTVFLAMGPAMVVGSYYVLAGGIGWTALIASLPVGFLVAAILHANNIRDLDQDRAAGKVTMANWRGRAFADAEYAALVAAAYPATLPLALLDPRLWPVLAVVVTSPAAYRLIRAVRRGRDAKALNLALRKTAGLHLRFGLLLAGGLLVATLLRGGS